MFRRKPRYLVDDYGNVRPIYHREGAFFPYLGRFLRRDETNLHAVKINGKWVLAEADGNEQRKTVELGHVIDRRRHLVKSFLLALLFGGLGGGILLFHWDLSASLQVAMTGLHDLKDRDMARYLFYITLVLVRCAAVVLLFFSYLYTLAVAVALVKELLYQLRFPFMRGARTTEMPQVMPSAAAPTAREKYDSDYVDRGEAVRRMRDDFKD